MEKYMSIGTVNVAMKRITSAPVWSSIALFVVTKKKKRYLDIVFANTVKAEQRIRANDENLVGVFNRGHNRSHVHRTLFQALK